MDLDQTKKLKTYFHQGYIVLLDGEKVIDMCEIESEMVPPIETGDEVWAPELVGYYTIETDGYIYTTKVISISQVEVMMPIDWYDLLTDTDIKNPAYMVFKEGISPITDYVEDLKNAYDEAGD